MKKLYNIFMINENQHTQKLIYKVLFIAFMLFMPILFIKTGFGLIYKMTMGILIMAIVIQISKILRRGKEYVNK